MCEHTSNYTTPFGATPPLNFPGSIILHHVPSCVWPLEHCIIHIYWSSVLSAHQFVSYDSFGIFVINLLTNFPLKITCSRQRQPFYLTAHVWKMPNNKILFNYISYLTLEEKFFKEIITYFPFVQVCIQSYCLTYIYNFITCTYQLDIMIFKKS